jgi:hypothetical protein
MLAPDTDARKPRFSYWRGYPERYRDLYRVGAKRAVISIAVLVMVPLGGAIAWFIGSAWAPLKIIFGSLLLALAGFGAVLCTRTVRALLFARMVPYFEKQLGQSAPFAGGSELARNAEKLDALAAAAGAAPLSSFGFEDDFLGETVKWHEPALALATIRTISQQVAASEGELKRDLELLGDALGVAASKRTRFALLLTTTYAPSDAERQKRQGFFA